MVLVFYKPRICIELYKLKVYIFELAIILPLFHTGQRDILPLTGEPHDHLGFNHRWLLLDSRVVDVLRVSNLILVTLASLKPFFFNGLKKAKAPLGQRWS